MARDVIEVRVTDQAYFREVMDRLEPLFDAVDGDDIAAAKTALASLRVFVGTRSTARGA